MTSNIMIIQTGGTIDKDYPSVPGAYNFVISEVCAAKTIMMQHAMNVKCTTGSSCKKDSNDITETDRQLMSQLCLDVTEKKILITHGTDTMLQTADFLASVDLQKTIVLTGAFRPAVFKNTDADFNVGLAVGALQCLDTVGVFIAINGIVSPWDKLERDSSGMYVRKS